MKVDGKDYRCIWVAADGWSVDVIDQTRLPFDFASRNLQTLEQACTAIRDMVVRGAPLIGATAAYGIYLAMHEDPADANLRAAGEALIATRPTAVNLRWAIERQQSLLAPLPPAQRAEAAFAEAAAIADEDVDCNRRIGAHGVELIRSIAATKPASEPVNILTHCNAGWLATVDWGTATAPIYLAHDEGIALHVWIDETRPRNQGALTAWELGQHGVPHTYIVDNAGGHLMQHGEVDLCLVGTDRTTRNGDVCNKIGTYLKALSARDNSVPFYVCLPGRTIDWRIDDGLGEVPIEQRDDSEITEIAGIGRDGRLESVAITPQATPVANHAFDVTPARLVTGLITERGVLPAEPGALRSAYPEYAESDAAIEAGSAGDEIEDSPDNGAPG